MSTCLCRRHAVSPRCPKHGWGWRTKAKLMTLWLYLVVLAFAVVGTARGAVAERPKWLPAKWYRLARCETGMRWRWGSQFAHPIYGGAFGIYIPTWQMYARPGEPRYPWNASPRLQLVVARRIAARHTMYSWGCWRNAWVRG